MEEEQIKKLNNLREPLPEKYISKLPKPQIASAEYKKLPKATCKVCGGYHATSKTAHLDYAGHAAITDRLLSIDPCFFWEPLASTEDGLPLFDKIGGMWINLTVCGMTRLGYGHAEKGGSFKSDADLIKEVIGDALRNAAMRFGVGLDLWHKGDLHKEPPPEEKSLTSADWEQRFEKEWDKTPKGVLDWRAKNSDEIKMTIANGEESLKLKKYLDDYAKEYPVEDRTLVDEFIKNIKIHKTAPIEHYKNYWKTKVKPRFSEFSEDHQNELIIANADMVKSTTERAKK